MNYLDLLEESYCEESKPSGYKLQMDSRLEYLSGYIFDFTTYCSHYDEMFARRAVEVCNAITERTTFEYIKDEEQHKWYLLMCNMPFFADRIEWGSSVRGAWWDAGDTRFFEIDSCGLWSNGKQILNLLLNEDDWVKFMRAIVAFANAEESTGVKV